MDELQEKLTQILQDPESLKQIMAFANTLSGEENEGEAIPLLQMLTSSDMLTKIQQILKQVNQPDEKQEALLAALSPYLKPERRNKLRRAIQIAHLSRLARVAWTTGSPLQEGVSSHV